MKKIYINPGHSDRDPGAVGYATERTLNVCVAAEMAVYLTQHFDCQVRVGSGDSLYALCDEANAWGADLFVSIHFNAAGGDGFECYVYSDKTVDLGRIFAKHAEAIGQNLRESAVAPGVKKRQNLAVLYRTVMPAVLVEGAFVDNLKDIQDWNDPEELEKMAAAYAQAAAEYLKLEEKPKEEEPKAEEPKAESPARWYRVQVGAYREKKNAEAMLKKLQAAGFADAYIREDAS